MRTANAFLMTAAIGLVASTPARAELLAGFAYSGEIGLDYSERDDSWGYTYDYRRGFIDFSAEYCFDPGMGFCGILHYDGNFSLDDGDSDPLDRLHLYGEYNFGRVRVGAGIVPSAIEDILTPDRITFPSLYDREVGAWFYGPTSDYLQYGDYDDDIFGIRTESRFGPFDKWSSFHWLPDTEEGLFSGAGRYTVSENFNVFGGFESRINWRNDYDDTRFWLGAQGQIGDFQITGTWNQGNAGLSTSSDVEGRVIDVLYTPLDNLTIGATYSELINGSWSDQVYAGGIEYLPFDNFAIEANIGTSDEQRDFFGIGARFRF